MSAPRVTVAAVIPHWNHRALLETAFRNSAAMLKSRPFDEIIVADNGFY